MEKKEINIVEERVDVVVIGAGLAGLVAAIEGARGGAKVAILDKLGPMGSELAAILPGRFGNDTSRAGGGGLARFSLEAPVDQLVAAHMEKGWGRIDADLIRNYLERVVEDCKWLRDLGLPFEGPVVKGKGPAICPFLYKVVEERGDRILFKAKAVKLLTDVSGRVTGIRVKTEQEIKDIKAKALVLATGGFEGNQEMLIKYVGHEMTYNTILTGCPTNTGDGHIMASEVGAQLINLSVCHVRTTDKFFNIGPSRHLRNIYPMGIYVNMDCKRFLDEGTADSDTIANAIVFQLESRAALIFDEKARSKYPQEYETYPSKEEVILKANSIEDLAGKIGLPPLEFRDLLESFNRAVKDDKALDLSIPKSKNAYKIDTPPFYAFYPVLTGLNHPLGGPKINIKGQVLDKENNPIPGLYAAGSIVNWSFGRPYHTAEVISYKGSYHAGESGGLAFALVSGRIAGSNAAKEALQSSS